MTREISNSDDVIDSRDVIDRIAELEERQRIEGAEHEIVTSSLGSQRYCKVCGHGGCEPLTDEALDEEEEEELAALKALAEEASGYAPDWQYGETLIRDSYFEDYARELAEDIGAISGKETWPLNHIDWDAAVRALQMDYTSVEFAGVTYWIR